MGLIVHYQFRATVHRRHECASEAIERRFMALARPSSRAVRGVKYENECTNTTETVRLRERREEERREEEKRRIGGERGDARDGGDGGGRVAVALAWRAAILHEHHASERPGAQRPDALEVVKRGADLQPTRK